MEHGLIVGDVVRLKLSFYAMPAGTKGIVYRTEPDLLAPGLNAAYVISEKGFDFEKVNVDQQNRYLEFIKRTDNNYQYDGLLQLKRDLMDGVFKDAFDF